MTHTPYDSAGEAADGDERPSAPPKPRAHLLSEYMSLEECADEIDKSKRPLQRWARLGQGPPRTRIGKTVKYRRGGARDWLRSQEEAVDA